MRANRLSEIDDLDVAALAQVHDMDRAPVRSGPADAGISVNRNVTEVMAWVHGDFVAINVYAGFAYDLSRIEIHDESSVVSLICDKEKTACVIRHA